MTYRSSLLLILLASTLCTASPEIAGAAPKGRGKTAAAKKEKKEGPRSVAVGPVTGPMAFSARRWIRETLETVPDQFALVDDDKAKALASDADEKAMAGFAKKNKAKAIIVGEVKKVPKGYTLTITVHGPDGVEMDGVEFEGGSQAKLKKSVESSLVTALQGVLGMGAAAPEAAEGGEGDVAPEAVVLEEDESAAKVAAKESEEPAKEVAPLVEEDKKPGSGLTALKIEVGGRARSRSYAYTDPLDAFYPELRDVEFPNESGARYPLADYSLAYPGVFAGLEWYPLAHFMDGIPTYFGLVGTYQKDALATTTAIGEDVISTASFSYFAGAKVRVPLGKHQVAAFGGIGEHAFDVGTVGNDEVTVISTNAAGMPTTGTRVSEVTVPSTDYKYVRAGAEGTVDFDPFAITVGAAYRSVGSLGELQDPEWFPFATAVGWDAAIRAEYTLAKFSGSRLALAAGVDYTRYAWKANSEPGGMPSDVATGRVAGGGVDNYTSGWLGVSFALTGPGGDTSVKAVASADETESSGAAAASGSDEVDATSDPESPDFEAD